MKFGYCGVWLSLFVSLFKIGAFGDEWRSVSNAIPSVSEIGFVSADNADSPITSVTDCEDICNGEAGNQCLSFAYSETVGCLTYDTRVGFNGANLIQNSNGYTYYDRPTDDLVPGSSTQVFDTLGDQIISRINDVGYENFLAWFRSGISARVDIDDTSNSDLEIMVTYSNIDTANDCAKLCLRERGVIDTEIGTRCDSFNYGESTCQLLSISWDFNNGNHELTSIQGDWEYYDRLEGDGCWITQEDCRKESSIIGTFEVTEDPDGATIEFEYQCMLQAKNYHENVCDGDATKATVAFWGGTDRQGVFDAWNSWDYSVGCVINLGTICDVSSERFYNTFRDSIAEEQFNAYNKESACFERAEIWNEYCQLGNSQTVNVSFATGGSYYIWPLINCTCDEFRLKTDISSELDFCTRNNSDNIDCWRPYQEDFWTYPDILCKDMQDGCPEYDSSDWPDDSSDCWLMDFLCEDESVRDSLEYDTNFAVPCTDYGSLDSDSKCVDFTAEDCANATQTYHDLCSNDPTDTGSQAVGLYIPTGEMFVYPDFELPASSTLIKGMDSILSYTNSDTSEYDMVSIGKGRWMYIFNGGSSRTVRQVDIWYEHDESASLTLSIYQGQGVTGSVKFETTSVGTFGPTDSGGQYIHFPIDSIIFETDTYYTWEVTSTLGNNDDGYIGFGIDYSNGVGDLTWDYIFVIWAEFYDTTGAPLISLDVIADELRPWFEIWFFILCGLLLLFIISLIFFHIKRQYDEKKEREEERARQREIKNQARLRAMARNDEDAEYYDDGNDYDYRELDDSEDDNNQQTQNYNTKNAIIEEEMPPSDNNIPNNNNNLKPNNDEDDVVTTQGKSKNRNLSHLMGDLDTNDIDAAFD